MSAITPTKDLMDCERDETSVFELKRMMIRMIKKMKEYIQKQVHEIKENMDKQLEKSQKQPNELKEDTNTHLNEIKEDTKKLNEITKCNLLETYRQMVPWEALKQRYPLLPK
jgi:hypothetical protein